MIQNILGRHFEFVWSTRSQTLKAWELKHLDAGCEALVDGIISPEVPKTRKSAAVRFGRVAICGY